MLDKRNHFQTIFTHVKMFNLDVLSKVVSK